MSETGSVIKHKGSKLSDPTDESVLTSAVRSYGTGLAVVGALGEDDAGGEADPH